jgi:DNA polymerase (family X)
MLDKFAIAGALREIAGLLEMKEENPFKVKAYINGADSLENTAEDIGALIDEHKLTKMRGIGEALSAKITELYVTGRSSLLEQLRAELPPGILEMGKVPGLSRRKIQALHKELGITSIAELRAAAEAGVVATISGFGKKTEAKILEGIKEYENREEKVLLIDAKEIADRLVKYLQATPGVLEVQVGGAIGRWQEAVEDMQVTVLASDKRGVIDRLKTFPPVTGIENENERHSSLTMRLANGMPLRASVCDKQDFASKVVRWSAADGHFQKLQKIAAEKSFDLNDDGSLFHNGHRLPVGSEGDFYAKLGLPLIPVELREDVGEIEEGLCGNKFDDLIDLPHIQGMTHCHTTFSDGRNSVEEMARAAQDLGMSYITITDHSPAASYAGGVTVDKLKRQWEEIERAREKLDIKILRGTESDILEDGALDYPDDILDSFDIIIASVHSRLRMDEDQMTKRLINCMKKTQFKIWGHALGRLVLRRPPLSCRVEEVLDVIAESNAAIEVNGDPYRLDMEPFWLRKARERGIKFIISTDAHAIRDFENLRFGVHLARRAGVRRQEVLNTLPVDDFRNTVKPKR